MLSRYLYVLLSLSLTACGDESGTTSPIDAGATIDSNSPAPDAAPASPTFYVDATGGDDSQDGTTPESAWKTLEKVSSAQLLPDTSIFLKRGETWFEQLIISDPKITIDAYGSGERPRIDGSVIADNWIDSGESIFSSEISITPDALEGLSNLSRDSVMLHPYDWNTDAAISLAGAPHNSYTYDFFSSTVFVRSDTPPSTSVFRASNKYYGIQASEIDDIRIKNISIRRFGLNGIEFRNCANCSVSEVDIKDGGGAVIAINGPGNTNYLYAGNGIEFDHSSTNGRVDDVVLSDIFDSCISPQTYIDGQAASTQTYSNMSLERCGFAGVEISVLSNVQSTGSSIEGISVLNSTIKDMGQGWSGRRYGTEGHGIRIGADNTAGTITNTLIEGVTISGSAGDGIHVFGETGITTIRQTSSHDNEGYGILFVDVDGHTTPFLQLESSLLYGNGNRGVEYACPSCQGFALLHNTFYNNTIINLGVDGQGGTATLKNNLFHSSSTLTQFFSATALSAPLMENNCYTEGTNMFGYNQSAYSSLATFRAATGLGNSSLGGEVGLNAPQDGDFSLLESSVCKTSGQAGLGVMSDFSGFLFASPPSSGAIQYR